MPQLAGDWPDQITPKVRDKFSLIDLKLQACGQQGASKEIVQPERLSERTGSISLKYRCDSPNPERLILAVSLWNKGLVWKEISKQTGIPERTARRYLRRMGFCRTQKFVGNRLKGVRKTEAHRLRISAVRIEKGIAKKEKNPNWKGGITSIWLKPEYRLWREAIFRRDGYTCKGCGKKNGEGKTVYLEAHHILPRRDFPHLTFELSNGITLCKECHDKTKKKEYLSISIWKQRVE